MGVVIEKMKNGSNRLWECKECHQLVAEHNTVAYHLVDRYLYGWCDACFSHRHESDKRVELAA
jgi:hypothetical protein